jgi:NDP-sugar pyrophosphorylase family protein
MIKVVILCGGKGYRLRPLTDNLPKPLVHLNGKPVLQHIIEFYIKKGFRDFVLCAGFNARAISDFASSAGLEARIEISNAGEDAGILKRIYEARGLIDGRAIVTYGDTFINIEPGQILDHHEKSGSDATITVAGIRSPFGIVGLTARGRVKSFEEKPVFSYYIGHMVVERKMLDALAGDLLAMPDGEGLVALFQELIKAKRLNAYQHTGLRITFNTLYERDKAEEEFIKFFTEQEGRS